jgi:hemoglobin
LRRKPTPSLYDKYGKSVDDFVGLFYRKVLADKTLAPFFAGVNMERQHRHTSAFMTYALGGPNHFTGRNMAHAHRGLKITSYHFHRVADHLSEAMKELKVEESDREVILNTIYTMENDIVEG